MTYYFRFSAALISALLAWHLNANASAPQPSRDFPIQKQINIASEGSQQPALAITIVEDAAKQAADEKEKLIENERNRKDLIAQEASALAAQQQVIISEKSMNLSMISLILSALGTIGLFGTIAISFSTARDSAKSAEAAGESAKAANASLALSNTVAKRQLRAYLGVGFGFPDVRPFIINPDHSFSCNGEFYFRLDVQNLGQTPAHNVAINLNFTTTPFQLPLPSDFAYPTIPRAPRHPYLSHTATPPIEPGRSVSRTLAMTDEERIQLGMATRRLLNFFAYGDVSYADIFGEWHRSEFCVSVILPVNATTLATTYYGPHNQST